MKSPIFWDIKAVQSAENQPTFRTNTLPPSSGLKSKLYLLPGFLQVSCLAYSSTLKMEVIYSSETSTDSQMDSRETELFIKKIYLF
jgi:hypothetical protein